MTAEAEAGWTVARAHHVLGQFAARELTLYGAATRRWLRRTALATLHARELTGEERNPVARVLDVYVDRRGVRGVVIACPHCGDRHVHGWPWGDDAVGHRLSHCRDLSAPLGYHVETPPSGERGVA